MYFKYIEIFNYKIPLRFYLKHSNTMKNDREKLEITIRN